MSLANDTAEILAPYLGQTVADTCVRATALSVGKSYDSLSREDLPKLLENIRRLLLPVAPAATIDGIVAEIQRRAA